MAVIGIIGGSGLYSLEGLTDIEEVNVDTPFGPTSDTIVRGRLSNSTLFFLPRHGRNHHLIPSEVPYRANVWALKSLGVEWVLSASAVGSLRRAIEPGQMVIVDQFIDRTKGRASTFFGEGAVAHISFGDPTCAVLRHSLALAASKAGATIHNGGTYVCMEGPAFSTRAESHMYRAWGGDVIGMTNLPEAKLAREAEISYATLGMATDYDCWNEEEENVSVEQVLSVLHANAALARSVVRHLVFELEQAQVDCACKRALDSALFTPIESLSPATRARLAPLLERHVGQIP